MRKIYFIFLIVITTNIFSLSQTISDTLHLYVSLNGNDKWSGRLPAPNNKNTDGPFKKIERTNNEVRTIIKNENQNKSIIVIDVELRGGVYNINTTLNFDSLNSGNQNIHIIYSNYNNEEVHLTGGVQISNFKKVTDENILKQLSTKAAKKVLCTKLRENGVTDFGGIATSGNWLELYFDNQPMNLARWPNQGFYSFKNVEVKDTTFKNGNKKITYAAIGFPDEHIKKWVNEENIYLHGYWYWNWSDSYEKVKYLDTLKNEIILEPPFSGYGYRNGQRFYAENILSELDTVGEWYLDRNTDELYFWPPSAISVNSIYLPQIESLIKMENVKNIEFDGLTFEATLGSCITINNAQSIVFKKCTIRNTGGYGITEKNVKDCIVNNCDLYNIAQMGIQMSGGDRIDLISGNNKIECSKIHNFALVNRTYNPGVLLEGVGNIVNHTEIYNAPHNAILIYGNNHLIENNYIHNVCYETSDVGAIYLGRDWTM
ncbi:MAG: right-handed parallel beta-helix repeat-containing protein [Bacteroidetes bacterium]|nr:right-handed parallel beta-helix repeat-containing protein [Bacteroidota bacterium]